MITSIDQLYDGFRSLVAESSGVPIADVILANQGKPPPKKKAIYATYNPVPVRAYGQPYRDRTLTPAEEPGPTPEWEDIAEANVTSLELMLSVNFLNEGARDAAWKMHNSSHRAPVRKILFDNEIAWRYAGEIRNMTTPYLSDFQPRYQLDIHLYIEVAITDTILRAAGFSFTVEDKNGDKLYQ